MKRRFNVKWQLLVYDLIAFILVQFLMFADWGTDNPTPKDAFIYSSVMFFTLAICRIAGNIYGQIWRYGGIQCYIRLAITDFCAMLLFLLLREIGIKRFFGITTALTFSRILSIYAVSLIVVLLMRMAYRYSYKSATNFTKKGRFFMFLMKIFAGKRVIKEQKTDKKKVNIAIIGAGRVGVGLAEDLTNNMNSTYRPRCFIDSNPEKAGRYIHGIPVFFAEESVVNKLRDLAVEEVVIAITNIALVNKKELYEKYRNLGYNVKVYDYPIMRTTDSKRQLREFDIDELLFRKQLVVSDELTDAYYKDKVVLITGGGGSIGSELCRQIATMQPKQIIVLDIYENGAYDVQQEIKIAYKGMVDIRVEVVSVCNKTGLERVFQEYRPNVVINAAAHKHVPLMEKNCIEAVENNVFGTLNTVELSEKYGVDRFIMVSTDKAVNPTNVMGATKRMCEMIVQSHSKSGTNTTFSATRFGNVLGSAGSVIPLFKRMIAAGGPVTVTDKRIVRYFMTIPEASQLVLQSGAMAENGELFVLDMGKAVKILELAENMIKLSGFEPYVDIDIVETGLRPGEKLYEELLVRTEELDKTRNSLIFIERDEPISLDELDAKLKMLRDAVDSDDDERVRNVLKAVVPTYHSPDEVNVDAEKSEEIRNCREFASVNK